MLPHRCTSRIGRIDIAPVAAALISPHTSPMAGSFSVDQSPPVAMSTVPTNASATPALSRSPGRRRPRMQTNSSTNSRFSDCSTVAVPAFVQLIEER